MTTYSASLESRYEVRPADIDRFERDGFVKLRNVLDPDVIAKYEPEITSQVIELNTMHLPMAERSTYDKAFLQIENLWRASDLARELVFAPRLARLAAELLGVNGVRLYHDQALYKEPGGGITPWHADQYYWPLSTDRCCTVWIPLQETPLEMGPLTFAAGSHRFEFGRNLAISDESEEALQQALVRQGFEHVIQPYALGDASFHLGWTFHHAGPNKTAIPRRVMTIIYIDADMRLAEPAHDLKASPPTSPAQNRRHSRYPINPVLYQRS